jgi:hypothetical protein
MLKRSIHIAVCGLLLLAGVEARAELPAVFLAGPGAADVREAASCGEAAEMHLPTDMSYTTWLHDPAIFAEEQGDRTELRLVEEPDVTTIKLTGLVPPIHFRLGEAEIPEDSIAQIRSVLDRMRNRTNVRLHFVGHADSLPLGGELQETFGDNLGLSPRHSCLLGCSS